MRGKEGGRREREGESERWLKSNQIKSNQIKSVTHPRRKRKRKEIYLHKPKTIQTNCKKKVPVEWTEKVSRGKKTRK